MLVSAISLKDSGIYNVLNYDSAYSHSQEPIGDTSFNSLTSFSKKNLSQKDMTKMFDNINEWQRFCHSQIMSGKLDIIA